MIHAEAQATADGLTALLLGGHLPQGADLEDVRIVPALSQGGMGKDEFQRRIKAEELLFVTHDQVVGVVVSLGGSFTLGIFEYLNSLATHLLFVDGKVSFVNICGRSCEVYFLEEGLVVRMIGEAAVFLLKDACIVAIHLVAIGVVLPIFLHSIDEKQAEHLDALGA